MPQRYFFHARLNDHVVPDETGVEICGLGDVKRFILEAILESGLNLSHAWRFEIADESGEIILVVPISDLGRMQ